MNYTLNGFRVDDERTSRALRGAHTSRTARLVVTVHRQVLPVDPAVLADEARGAGLAEVQVAVRPRQQKKVELLAI
ncbi:MAG: hypothetical protein ACRDTT_16430 [Pseudonocardiaceae bacterium]